MERFHGDHKADKGAVRGDALEALLASADKGCRRVQLPDGMGEYPPSASAILSSASLTGSVGRVT